MPASVLRTFETKNIIFIVALVAHVAFFSLKDPDYYLHIMAGKYMVAHKSLSYVDVFSFTMAGQPWHLHEWLFEVFVYSIYAVGNEHGVVLFVSGVSVLALFVVFRAGLTCARQSYGAILITLLFLIVYLPFIQPRPQIITFVCYAMFLFVIFDYKYRDTLRFAPVLPFLMVIWVNAHGAYIFGIAILWLFIACEYLRRYAGAEDNWRGNKLRQLSLIAIATSLSSAINPYFVKHWIFPFTLMHQRTMVLISEWRSPDFTHPFFQIYLFVIALFAIHYIYLKKRPDLTELVLPGSVIFISFLALRHIPLAILTMLPFTLVTAACGHEFKGIFHLSGNQTFIDRVISYRGTRDIGKKEYFFNGTLLSVVLLLFVISRSARLDFKQENMNQMLPGTGGRLYFTE